jgi:hypothetical protein
MRKNQGGWGALASFPGLLRGRRKGLVHTVQGSSKQKFIGQATKKRE